MAQIKTYDVVIIGTGPAALTASIYASRYKLTNIMIGKQLGGELSYAHKVENYPGFDSISGIELASKWKAQVERLGGQIIFNQVGRMEKLKKQTPKGAGFLVEVDQNTKYYARTLIVSTGSERKRLNIPGEKEYLGRGVSYCTTCDSPFYRNKTVVLVGGSDSAVSGAVHTAEYASKVYIVYRGEKLRAEPIWIDEWQKLEKEGKGETIYNSNIEEILGNKQKVMLVLLDKPYKGSRELKTDGVFIEIGGVPGTTLVQPMGVKLDDTGHVITDGEMKTNIPGLFAAGDMVDKAKIMQQAITAMAQGAIAAASAYKYIKKESAPQIKGI